jgi:hypothetical protein
MSINLRRLILSLAVLVFSLSAVFADEDIFGDYQGTAGSGVINVSNAHVSISNNNYFSDYSGSGIISSLNDYNIAGGVIDISALGAVGSIFASNNYVSIDTMTAGGGTRIFGSNVTVSISTPNAFNSITANNNIVILSNSAAVAELTGAYVDAFAYGGDIKLNDNSVTADNVDYIASIFGAYGFSEWNSDVYTVNNTVNVDSVAAYEVYGAMIDHGINAFVSSNSVALHNVNIDTDGRIAGGFLYNSTYATVNFNTVSLDNVVFEGLGVYGGYIYRYAKKNADANYNSISINNSIILSEAEFIGGVAKSSGNANANGNLLDIKNTYIDAPSYYGGAIAFADSNSTAYAADNIARIKNSSGTIAGVVSARAQSVNGNAYAERNSVEIENIDGDITDIYAGIAVSSGLNAYANNNNVNIDSVTSIVNAYGGHASNYSAGIFGDAYANNNVINIDSVDYIERVIGGYSYSENNNAYANSNTVSLHNVNVEDLIAGGFVEKSYNGTANFNSVVLDSVTVTNGVIFGGVFFNNHSDNDANANSNSILIQNSFLVYSAINTAGAVSHNGNANANNNRLEIYNTDMNYVYGIHGAVAYSGASSTQNYAQANNNSGIIENISGVIDEIIAGYAFSDAYSSIFASSNTIFLKNSIANIANLYGGHSSGTFGDAYANNNVVNIDSVDYIETVRGGFSYSENNNAYANSNTVSLHNVNVNDLIGGYIEASYNGTANFNSVFLDSVTVATGQILGGRILPSDNDANANSNSVLIQNSFLFSHVMIGAGVAQSQNGNGNVNANNNSVEIYDTNIDDGAIVGGYAAIEAHLAQNYAQANNNSVLIENLSGVIDQIFAGGALNYGSSNVSASSNTIFLKNSIANIATLYGGYTYSENSATYANNNVINIDSVDCIETVVGGYSHGESNSAYASSNIVSLHNVNVNKLIAGGYIDVSYGTANGGTANFNSVVLESVIAIVDIYGASVYSDYGTVANSNSILIQNSHLNGGIYGSFARSGGYAESNSNSVLIRNSYIYSGHAGFVDTGGSGNNSATYAEANNNKIEIYDSYINGGYIRGVVVNAYDSSSSTHNYAQANNNSVIIENISGIVSDIRAGRAYSDGGASANANTISVSGNTEISNQLIAGYAEGTSDDKVTAVNNTVSITGNITFLDSNSVLYGGFANNNGAGGVDYITGNTLNLKTNPFSVKYLGGFENYNFYLTKEYIDNSISTPLISVNGGFMNLHNGDTSEFNIDGANVQIYIDKTASLNIGDTITLIASTNAIIGTPKNNKSYTNTGLVWINNFDIYVDSNTLLAGFAGKDLNPKTKSFSESVAAGAAFVNQGADIAADLSLPEALDEKMQAFAAVYGGKSRYNTGSYSDINSFGVIAGLAKDFKSVITAVFAQYSGASYETDNSFESRGDVIGDGDASYIGAGLTGRKNIKENVYVQGVIRAGQLSNKSDMKDEAGNEEAIDISSIYTSVNIGAGYILKVNEKILLDVSGKYFFAYQAAGDLALSTGDKYEYDSIMSNRLRAGLKGRYALNEKIKPYAAIGYDYEISGDVNAKIDGKNVDAPTLNGGTAMAELGAQADIANNLTLDITLQGYAGVREGFNAILKVKYAI